MNFNLNFNMNFIDPITPGKLISMVLTNVNDFKIVEFLNVNVDNSEMGVKSRDGILDLSTPKKLKLSHNKSTANGKSKKVDLCSASKCLAPDGMSSKFCFIA